MSMPKAGLRIQVQELDEAYTEAEQNEDLDELLDEIGLFVYQFGVLGDIEGTIEDLEEAGIYDVDAEFELAGDDDDDDEIEEND